MDCPPDKIIFDSEKGEYICTETGEVLEERVVDQGAEWRAYTPEEKMQRSRVGAPIDPLIHDLGISTVIDWKDSDAMGNNFDENKRKKMMRLRKWHLRTNLSSSHDRNLFDAMNEIERISSLLNLPKVAKDEAALIYRKALERDLMRGRSIDQFVAASIYIACRQMRLAITLEEIARHTKINKKDIARTYRLLLGILKIKVLINDSRDYIMKAENILNLKTETIRKAIEIAEKAKKVGIGIGKDPASLAAGAIYIACVLNDDLRTQREIAVAVGVTEVTLRTRYKEIAKALNINLNPS